MAEERRQDRGILLEDQGYLLEHQYANTGKLGTRQSLHDRFSTNPKGWHTWVFDHLLEASPGGKILEVGCGSGALWRKNAYRMPETWQVIFADFSRGVLKDIRDDGIRGARVAGALNQDVQNLGLADAAFDTVVANHMLYHVPDRPRALGEVWRVLKDGGTFFAATNGQRSLRELADLARPFFPKSVAARERQRMGGGFSLENGGTQLEAIFRRVELRRYEDGLAVTEADPLVNYLMTMSGHAEELDRMEEREPGHRATVLRTLKERVEKVIREEWAFHGRKDVGMFVARAE